MRQKAHERCKYRGKMSLDGFHGVETGGFLESTVKLHHSEASEYKSISH